ncbi:hypothetical protein V8E36_008426 [Tilletia maclaganii]
MASRSTASPGTLHGTQLHPALRPFLRGSSATRPHSYSTRSAHPNIGTADEIEVESESEPEYEFEYNTEDVEAEYGSGSRLTPSLGDGGGDAGAASISTPVPTTYPPEQDSSTTVAPPLAPDQPLHDALSSELLRLSTVLKSNALAFGASLERDRLLLAKSSDQLGANLDFMTRTRGRLGEYSRKARGMGWFTLGSIAVVMASWVLCFILIRLT